MAMLINENVSRQAKRISFLSVTVWFLGSLDPKSGYSTKRQCRSFSKAIPLMPVPARSPLPGQKVYALVILQAEEDSSECKPGKED